MIFKKTWRVNPLHLPHTTFLMLHKTWPNYPGTTQTFLSLSGATILYLSNRAHIDIYLSVSFLFTTVREPDTDDINYLSRVMKYIQGTIGLPLTLSIDKYGNIKWYVDASFTAHKYMRIHNGGFTTMVTWGSYVQYSKQKLNIKSSTESKIVGVYNFLTQVI